MPFPAKLLNDGEEIVVDVRPHWRYLAPPVAAVAVLVAGSIAVAVIGVPSAVDWVVVAVLVIGVGWLLGRYLRWMTTNLIGPTSA